MQKILLFILAFFSFSVTLSAQWSMNTMVNTVVCDTSGLQKDVRMESDGSGGVFMVWRDYRKGTNSSDIYAQRLDSFGFPMWTKNGVAICTLAADQSTPAIISDDKGGIIIAWSDWRSGIERDLYAQRLDGNGNILWTVNGAPITTENAREHSQKIIRDDHSGLIAVWEKQRTNGSWDIWAQRLDSTGSPVWVNGGIAVCQENSNRINHKAQRDGDGGMIISFQDARGGDYDIYAQRLDGNGTRLWSNAGKPVCIAPGVQNNAKIDPEKKSDGVYISWIDARNQQDYDIYCQRLDSNGNSMWGVSGLPVCAASGNQSAQDIISNNKVDGVIITWKDDRNGNVDIYAQKLESTGLTQWANDGIVICDAPNDQLNPNIISDKDSGAIVTWQDERAADWDIYAQRIGKDGVVRWTNNGVVVCNAVGDQEAPKNVPDNNGGTIIAWKDERTGPADDIYAHHLTANAGPNAVKDFSSSIEQLKVFPNPIQNEIHLKVDLSSAENIAFLLFDPLGRPIYSFNDVQGVYSQGKHSIQLDLTSINLSSGLYILQLRGDKGWASIKLVKE